MFRFTKWLPVIVGLAVAVTLAATAPARAEIVIDYSLDGGTTILQAASSSTNTVTFSGALGGYTIGVSAGVTNAGGTPTLAFVNSTNNTIMGSNTSNPNDGLILYVSADGFTSPGSPPPALLSTGSSANTAPNSSAVTVTYAGYVGTSLLDNSVAVVGPGTYTAPGNAGSGSGTDLSTLFNAPSSYTLTDVLSISAGSVNIAGLNGNVDVTPTPEPATMMAAFTALPFLGIGTWLRRRKQAV
jgi:hypothetical protein